MADMDDMMKMVMIIVLSVAFLLFIMFTAMITCIVRRKNKKRQKIKHPNLIHNNNSIEINIKERVLKERGSFVGLWASCEVESGLSS